MAAPPFKVKATYDYSSGHDDDLSFPEGQIITVTEEEDDDWYVGEYVDSTGNSKSGLFPKNFVERFEPAPPPRPSRSNRPKLPSQQFEQVEQPAQPETASEAAFEIPKAEEPRAKAELKPAQAVAQPPSPTKDEAEQLKRNSTDSAAPKPKVASAKSPPPVAEKSASFRDRIAAFNKPAAAPVTPFKPSSSGSTGFIKKPFVAPPPSRDAYVPPPPRDHQPHKVYRREEDPEIIERRSQDQENAERAGLTGQDATEDAEEQPRAVSLKERIALLQKQQAEQAARRSEGVSREKPKKPTKKISDGGELVASEEPMGRPSLDAERSRPAVPVEGLQSDGNDADQSAADELTEDPDDLATSVDDITDTQEGSAKTQVEPEAGESDEGDSIGEEMDEEARHQMALRERMAKLSGGMGMPGMFGPPGGMPLMGAASTGKKKKSEKSPTRTSKEEDRPQHHRIPIVPTKETAQPSVKAPAQYTGGARQLLSNEAEGPSSSIADNASTNEPALSPSPGSESDDELPGTSRNVEASSPPVGRGPVPPLSQKQPSMATAANATFPRENAVSEPDTDGSPSGTQSYIRAAPPPPPVPREISSTLSQDESAVHSVSKVTTGGESEYEGDYDTDIASGEEHKDALKAHVREPSLDESLRDEALARSPPPVPNSPTPVLSKRLSNRPPPPAPPTLPPTRSSIETPRAPPPAPPQDLLRSAEGDYDPFSYRSPVAGGLASPTSPAATSSAFDDTVSPIVPRAGPPPIPSSRELPPPPAPAGPPPVPRRSMEARSESSGEEDNGEEDDKVTPTTSRRVVEPSENLSEAPHPVVQAQGPTGLARRSQDKDRMPITRRSMDQYRSTASHGYIASDIDLDRSSGWWREQAQLPFQLRNRTDICYEFEKSSESKRGGKTTYLKDLYVLFQDYSQTIITARYDPTGNIADVSLDQRHEPPPPPLRQDQLEAAYNQFGAKVSQTLNTKQNTVVGDGTPMALITELLTPLTGVLRPIGTRSFGAPVYANLANATVQQHDEIRPGDIVTFRNARFQGKHSGVIHQKYTMEAGKPDHVGIVVEWDGTKKKIRAAEQGRESKKCKVESFRLGDLRSGEVRVWRLVSRSWVGWDGNHS